MNCEPAVQSKKQGPKQNKGSGGDRRRKKESLLQRNCRLSNEKKILMSEIISRFTKPELAGEHHAMESALRVQTILILQKTF